MCFYILVILELYVLPESEYILSQIKGRQNIANPLIKRELVTFLIVFQMYCDCECLWLLTVLWVGLQYLIVVFPDHTRVFL